MTKRKRYSAEFKAKVALEALREDLTTAELAKKYDIHPTMITGWKRTAIENMASAFGGKDTAEPTISAGEVEKLHAKIGQLVVERDLYVGVSVKRHVCHWQRSVPTGRSWGPACATCWSPCPPARDRPWPSHSRPAPS